jgi:hypothetical protein
MKIVKKDSGPWCEFCIAYDLKEKAHYRVHIESVVAGYKLDRVMLLCPGHMYKCQMVQESSPLIEAWTAAKRKNAEKLFARRNQVVTRRVVRRKK